MARSVPTGRVYAALLGRCRWPDAYLLRNRTEVGVLVEDGDDLSGVNGADANLLAVRQDQPVRPDCAVGVLGLAVARAVAGLRPSTRRHPALREPPRPRAPPSRALVLSARSGQWRPTL